MAHLSHARLFSSGDLATTTVDIDEELEPTEVERLLELSRVRIPTARLNPKLQERLEALVEGKHRVDLLWLNYHGF